MKKRKGKNQMAVIIVGFVIIGLVMLAYLFVNSRSEIHANGSFKSEDFNTEIAFRKSKDQDTTKSKDTHDTTANTDSHGN